MILDGYEAVQESSTDEESAVWLPPQPGTSLPATDPAQQQRPSSQKVHSDGAVSLFTLEPLAPQCWGAMEGACLEIQSPSACTDSPSQVLECIRKIEAALEHLKVPGPRPPQDSVGGSTWTRRKCRVIEVLVSANLLSSKCVFS